MTINTKLPGLGVLMPRVEAAKHATDTHVHAYLTPCRAMLLMAALFLFYSWSKVG